MADISFISWFSNGSASVSGSLLICRGPWGLPFFGVGGTAEFRGSQVRSRGILRGERDVVFLFRRLLA